MWWHRTLLSAWEVEIRVCLKCGRYKIMKILRILLIYLLFYDVLYKHKSSLTMRDSHPFNWIPKDSHTVQIYFQFYKHLVIHHTHVHTMSLSLIRLHNFWLVWSKTSRNKQTNHIVDLEWQLSPNTQHALEEHNLHLDIYVVFVCCTHRPLDSCQIWETTQISFYACNPRSGFSSCTNSDKLLQSNYHLYLETQSYINHVDKQPQLFSAAHSTKCHVQQWSQTLLIHVERVWRGWN